MPERPKPGGRRASPPRARAGTRSSRRSWSARRAGTAAPRRRSRRAVAARCARRPAARRSRRCGRSPRAPAEDIRAVARRTSPVRRAVAGPLRQRRRPAATVSACRDRSAGRTLDGRVGVDAPSRARVVRIRERLREVYGIPLMRPHGHPIAELVLTVLSQSTNDRNRDVAFLRLRERFADAGRRCATRPSPRSRRRSARAASRRSSRRASRRSCARSRTTARPATRSRSTGSRDAPIEEARDYLVALPGVGRKTAACVLLFAYGLRDVPVDTHVSRVGMRLRPAAPGRAVRGAARPDARAHAARRRSSSCTSTCCATAGAPATRAARLLGCALARDVPEPASLLARAGVGQVALSPGQHGERDHRVVQRGRGEHERVEDLVVAEHLRPRVRPAARVHDRADRRTAAPPAASPAAPSQPIAAGSSPKTAAVTSPSAT